MMLGDMHFHSARARVVQIPCKMLNPIDLDLDSDMCHPFIGIRRERMNVSEDQMLDMCCINRHQDAVVQPSRPKMIEIERRYLPFKIRVQLG